MSPGSSTESYSAFARTGLRENPGKKPQPGKILRKRLRFHPYRIQLLQALKLEDKVLQRNFCISMQTLIGNDDEFIRSVVFFDETTFHLSAKSPVIFDNKEYSSKDLLCAILCGFVKMEFRFIFATEIVLAVRRR
ncbi:hypothetical protein ANN_09224 [Periplaneta americana]|uniref:Uncharacterized protein n=1 Tax=Periplaneta americana TaxID=6978 RepID=A0ABQ8TL41_PERAM|nr:hypothetical protein ANN_09224 [Periplaneta americana]